jgi:hypothetical protein
VPDPTQEQLIHDVEQIIQKLGPDGDTREWPDTLRRRNFLIGWGHAVKQGRDDYQSNPKDQELEIGS